MFEIVFFFCSANQENKNTEPKIEIKEKVDLFAVCYCVGTAVKFILNVLMRTPVLNKLNGYKLVLFFFIIVIFCFRSNVLMFNLFQ